jgi:hypothetical protein
MDNSQNPQLKVFQVINKCLILWGIKLTTNIPVYYYWKKRQPKWIISNDTGEFIPKESYLTVDYNKQSREWHIGYIVSKSNRKYATIDDITGSYSIIN